MKKVFLTIIALLLFIFCSCKLGKAYIVVYHEQIENGNIVQKNYSNNIINEEPHIFTKENYEFAGWYSDSNLSTKITFPYKVDGNTDLYAKWLRLYKIIFIDGDTTILQSSIAEGNLISNYEITNNSFIGWSTNSDSFVPFDFSKPITNDVTLYAFYNKDNQFLVSFYDENNLIYTATINENDIGSSINPPDKNGYTFKGWSTNKTSFVPFDFTKPITTNINLYAFYAINSYTVKFINDGKTYKNNIVLYNQTLTKPNNPSKAGYSFIGWSSNSDSFIQFDFSKPITNDITLYAFYNKDNQFLVSFYDDTNLIYTATINENDIASSINPPDKNGYTFKGWSSNSDSFVPFDFTKPITTNINLYAFYTELFTVTFNVDGTKTPIIVKDGNIVETPETPNKAGYTFIGWYLDDNEFDFSTPIKENIELKAKFSKQENTLTSYGGYTGGLYFEAALIDGINTTDYIVQYKSSSASKWIEADKALIRKENNKIRCDIIGLKAGEYDVKIILNKTTTNIKCTVANDDYSGYAHFNYSDGVGAYNNDGTLKKDAIVIYITNENKNSVTITANKKTYTGLVNIIQNQSNIGKPLDIRIIGKITTNQFKAKSNEPRLIDNSNLSDDFFNNELETSYGENLVGLTVQYMDKKAKTSYKFITAKTGLKSKGTGNSSYKKTTYKGSEYKALVGKEVYDDDSYFNMLDVDGQSNITVQGIGTNAEIFQWGFTWKNCNSIEIKNLTFTDYTEDACSFEGKAVKDYGNYWIHNNTFNRGKNNWDISGERDKYAGDGGCDLKQVHNITLSYNKFNNCKKTGLVGGNDDTLTMNITFHHNYYYKVESRLPLGRQANMHIYNNYYDNCGTCQDIRANAFVLSEENYFYKCTYPQKVTANDSYNHTVIKSVNDIYDSCKNKSQAIASARIDILTGNCKPDGTTSYTNFDTNAHLFYYNSTSKKTNVDNLLAAKAVKEYCQKYSGALNNNMTR